MRAFWILALIQLSLTLTAAEFSVSSDEQKILEFTNKEREKEGAPALKMNEKLFQAARDHSRNMARQQILSHGLDGKQAWDRVSKTGYKYTAVAENVAFNQKSPKGVVTSWMNSPGHRENILNKQYTEIGIGIAKDEDGKPYYTQVFARPAKKGAPEMNETPEPIAQSSDDATLADLKQQLENLERKVNEPPHAGTEPERTAQPGVTVLTSATFTIHNQSDKAAIITLPSGSTSQLGVDARGTYKITAVGAAPVFSVSVGKQTQRVTMKDRASYKLEIEDGKLELWMKAAPVELAGE